MGLIKKTKAKYSKVKQLKLDAPVVSRALFVLISLIFISIFIDIRLVVFLVAATMFNAWLADFQAKRGFPTDFELSTFSTVIVSSTFGLKWGIFIAIFSKLFASIFTGNLLADHFFMIMTYINAAVLASFIHAGSILYLGMGIVIVNAVLMFLISKNILGLDITSNLSYTTTNVLFNLIVFSIFSELVYSIMS